MALIPIFLWTIQISVSNFCIWVTEISPGVWLEDLIG